MRIWIQSSGSVLAGVVFLGVASPVLGQRGESCAPAVEGTVAGIVRGVVTDRDTRVPLRGAEVRLSWRPEGDRRQRDEKTQSDARGAFHFCDAPAGSRVIVKASFAGKSSRGEPVEVSASAPVKVDLQIDAPHSEIVGRVVEYGSGRPVPTATVRLRGTPLTQVTPPDGKFKFSAVPPGRYAVDIQHVAYRAVNDTVELELGTNMDVTVRLAPNVIPLNPLVVTVRSLLLERRGFYERQQRGLGEYVTRAEIERSKPLLASELLRGVAGIRLVRRNSGHGYAALGRGNCAFRYVVNGSRVGPGFELDDVAPEWIEALEVYRGPATIPMEFSTFGNDFGGSCGVIVIWTRNR
jgi:hypothetical protein